MSATEPATTKPETTIAPNLVVADALGAIAFYIAAFGAVELYRVGADAGVAQLSIDGAPFWISEGESRDLGRFTPETLGGRSVGMILTVDDPDEVFSRAVAAGSTVDAPMEESHGWRSGRIVDPFGHHWEIARPTRTLASRVTTRQSGRRRGSSSTTREGGMKAKVIAFGEIEIEGRLYAHDVVIEGGKVEKRRKKPSKAYREEFGHTPLSIDERIPWGGSRLIVGTGRSGSLPIMPAVSAEADRRGVDLVARPTEEALRLIRDVDARDVYAIIHVTC